MSASGLKPATRTEAEARLQRAMDETPVPWKLIEVLGGISIHAGSVQVLSYRDPTPCNVERARFIHRAVNSHDAMADILERLVTGIKDMRRRKVIDAADDDQWLNVRLAQAEAALKAAKGEA